MLCWFALVTDTTNWQGFADQFILAWFITAFSPWAKTWTWLEWHSNHWVQGVCEHICALNTLKTIACWKTGSEPILHCCMKKITYHRLYTTMLPIFVCTAYVIWKLDWTCIHLVATKRQHRNDHFDSQFAKLIFFTIKLLNISLLRWNQSYRWFHCREMEAAFASNKIYWIRKTHLAYGSF